MISERKCSKRVTSTFTCLPPLEALKQVTLGRMECFKFCSRSSLSLAFDRAAVLKAVPYTKKSEMFGKMRDICQAPPTLKTDVLEGQAYVPIS
jgi:hypothetical protein